MGDQTSTITTTQGVGLGIVGIIIWVVAVILFWIVPIILTYRTMVSKGNSGALGIVLGVVLGGSGCIIALVMPRRTV